MEDILGEASPERREGELLDRRPDHGIAGTGADAMALDHSCASYPKPAAPRLPRAFLEKLCWPPILPNADAKKSSDALNPATALGGYWSLEASQAYCRQLACKHYENFTVAGWLTPTTLRQPIADIYAFCRWADDLADELPGGADERLAALDWWQSQLIACWNPPTTTGGRNDVDCPHPVFVALRATRERFDLEAAPFLALLAAFRQDQTQSRYDTWDELLAYCRHSAAPVGRLMLRLARVDDRREPELGEWSDAICAGLQIANFCQDVRGDWQRGRIYLPREAWRLRGCDEFDFAGGHLAKLAPVVRDAVELAAGLLHFGRPLLATGPAWLRSDLALFLGGGEAILQAIRDRRYDVWTDRPVVSRWAKWRLLPTALRALLAARRTTESSGNRE